MDIADYVPPPPPPNMGERATRLWVQVTDRYELDAHELALLEEVGRTMRDLDILAERVESQGHTIAGRVNPALTEARQMRITFARLVAALRLPEEDSGERPQRRVGARGTYAGAI